MHALIFSLINISNLQEKTGKGGKKGKETERASRLAERAGSAKKGRGSSVGHGHSPPPASPVDGDRLGTRFFFGYGFVDISKITKIDFVG